MNDRNAAFRAGFGAVCILLALGLSGLAAAAASKGKLALIKSALSAAPPDVAKTAKVVTMEGEVLRDGKGPFTCFPREGKGTSPMCLDAEWMRWANAWMKRTDFKATKVGLAYMLAGDMKDSGASNIDPFAKAATPDNQWIVEGPHVMIIVPDPALPEGVATDPKPGVPYVMWKGTPYAHIMMPVASRRKK